MTRQQEISLRQLGDGRLRVELVEKRPSAGRKTKTFLFAGENAPWLRDMLAAVLKYWETRRREDLPELPRDKRMGPDCFSIFGGGRDWNPVVRLANENPDNPVGTRTLSLTTEGAGELIELFDKQLDRTEQ